MSTLSFQRVLARKITRNRFTVTGTAENNCRSNCENDNCMTIRGCRWSNGVNLKKKNQLHKFLFVWAINHRHVTSDEIQSALKADNKVKIQNLMNISLQIAENVVNRSADRTIRVSPDLTLTLKNFVLFHLIFTGAPDVATFDAASG